MKVQLILLGALVLSSCSHEERRVFCSDDFTATYAGDGWCLKYNNKNQQFKSSRDGASFKLDEEIAYFDGDFFYIDSGVLLNKDIGRIESWSHRNMNCNAVNYENSYNVSCVSKSKEIRVNYTFDAKKGITYMKFDCRGCNTAGMALTSDRGMGSICVEKSGTKFWQLR